MHCGCADYDQKGTMRAVITREIRHSVIGMWMAALELDNNTDDELPGELTALLAEPFAYEATLTYTVGQDPVPADEVARIVDGAVRSFRDGYAEHLQGVVPYINFLFSDLVREVQVLNPDFDAREFLRRHALAALDDEPEAWQQG
jgi:hypothetical protein